MTTHSHHHCQCEHERLRYCKKCKVVYCLDCKEEWAPPCTQSHWPYYWGTYTIPYGSGNWTVSSRTSPIATSGTVYCAHGDEVTVLS